MNEPIYDFAIIGAGMAGASLAAELCRHARLIVLEAEDTPGYHATGRSAAFWDECYGGAGIVPLTLASGPYLRDNGFLKSRGAVHIARDCDMPAIKEFMAEFADTGVSIERLDRAAIAEKIPHLRQEWQHGIWEPTCADVDVGALHAHYLKQLKSNGVPVQLRSKMTLARFSNGVWDIGCSNGGNIKAANLINAAGAWADELAAASGVKRIGIKPMRRTVAQLRVSPYAPDDLPLVLDINGGFYFKPDNGRLWLSPHDEVPSDPCDAAADELDVAKALDRFEKVVDWKIENVERRWAGLRSFAPDRLPVYGRDLHQPAFVWFAGQGGFGIQTAPAAARLMAQELLGQATDNLTVNIRRKPYSPARFH